MRTKDFGQTSSRSLGAGKMSRKRSKSRHSFLGTSESDDTDDGVPSKRLKVEVKWDPYCWLCHEDGAKRRCSTCIRSYHDVCIGAKDDTPKSGYKCELCIRMQAAKDDYNKRNVNMEHINKMLSHVTMRLQNDKQFKRFKADRYFSQLRQPKKPGPNIINPFNLDIVMEKVEHSNYMTTLEFMNDIKWIRHNAEIVLNESDSRLEMARTMEKLCEMEMYDIEMCGECFHRASKNPDNWFTAVCNPPHLVVWARMSREPYWPAKVIGDAGGDSVHKKIDVRFFGTHERQNILVSNCRLFTESPNEKTGDKNLDEAIKEAEKYIHNIEKKYSCTVNRPKKAQFTIQEIGRHLRNMIPKLKIPDNFKLKGKPLYLRKYQPRKCGKQPNKLVKPMVNALTIEEKFRMMDCSVRLEKCDEMIHRVLSNQHEKAKKRKERRQQYEDEGIESDKSDKSEGGKRGSSKDTDVRGASVEEADRNEEIGLEKGAEDDNEQDEGANDLHQIDSTEKPEDDTNERVQIKSKRDDFMHKEYERRLHRAIDHMNNFELVVKLKSYSEDEVKQTCIDNSTGDGDDDMDTDHPSTGADEGTIIDTGFSSEMDQYTIKSPAYEPLGRKSPENVAANDDEEMTCRKDPAPRTYERRSRRMTISCDGNMNAIRVDEPTSNTNRAKIAQKSNESTHEANLANPNEAPVDKSPENEASVVSGDDTPINNDSTQDQNNMHSVMVPYLFEDLDDGRDYSDVSDPFGGVLDPFSDVAFENEPPQTSMETEENAEEMPEERSQPEPETEFSANEQESPRNSSMNDDSEVVANTAENDEQSDESIESTVTTDDADNDKIEQNQFDAAKDWTNDQSDEEPENNEVSTIAIATTGAAQTVHEISQVHTDNITNNENLIQSQKAELLEKDKQIDDLLAQLAEKKKVENELNMQIQMLQQQYDAQIQKAADQMVQLKKEHDAQLQKAIDDTKNEDWCTICKTKIAIKNFHPYVCGRDCLHQLWEKCKENSNSPRNGTQKQIHINGKVLVSSHSDIPSANRREQSSNVDDMSFSEINEF